MCFSGTTIWSKDDALVEIRVPHASNGVGHHEALFTANRQASESAESLLKPEGCLKRNEVLLGALGRFMLALVWAVTRWNGVGLSHDAALHYRTLGRALSTHNFMRFVSRALKHRSQFVTTVYRPDALSKQLSTPCRSLPCPSTA